MKVTDFLATLVFMGCLFSVTLGMNFDDNDTIQSRNRVNLSAGYPDVSSITGDSFISNADEVDYGILRRRASSNGGNSDEGIVSAWDGRVDNARRVVPENSKLLALMAEEEMDVDTPNAVEYYRNDPKRTQLLKQIAAMSDSHNYLVRLLKTNFRAPKLGSYRAHVYENSKLWFDNEDHMDLLAIWNYLRPVFPEIYAVRLSPYYIIINSGNFSRESVLSEGEYDDYPNSPPFGGLASNTYDTYNRNYFASTSGHWNKLYTLSRNASDAAFKTVFNFLTQFTHHRRGNSCYRLHVLLHTYSNGHSGFSDQTFARLLKPLLSRHTCKLFVKNFLDPSALLQFPQTTDALRQRITVREPGNCTALELWDSNCFKNHFCPLLAKFILGGALATLGERSFPDTTIKVVTLKVTKLATNYEVNLTRVLSGKHTALSSFGVYFTNFESFRYDNFGDFRDSGLKRLMLSSVGFQTFLSSYSLLKPFNVVEGEESEQVRTRRRLYTAMTEYFSYPMVDLERLVISPPRATPPVVGKKFAAFVSLDESSMLEAFQVDAFRLGVSGYSALTVHSFYYGAYSAAKRSEEHTHTLYSKLENMLNCPKMFSNGFHPLSSMATSHVAESFKNLESLQIVGDANKLESLDNSAYFCPLSNVASSLLNLQHLSLRRMVLKPRTLNMLAFFLLFGKLKTLTIDISWCKLPLNSHRSRNGHWRNCLPADLEILLTALKLHTRRLSLTLISNSKNRIMREISFNASRAISLELVVSDNFVWDPRFPSPPA